MASTNKQRELRGMLNRLRFQEVDKVILKTREDTVYAGKSYLKGEPVMIIDSASVSNFFVDQREKTAIGKTSEASTSTIRGVSFTLSNGKIMLDMFNTIFSKVEKNKATQYTVNGSIQLLDEDVIDFPVIPNNLILYLTDEYGNITRIGKDQYTLDDKRVVFIKKISHLITFVYERDEQSLVTSKVRQGGANPILSLEMQCVAMDVFTEEKIRVLIKFEKVSVGASLDISFNDSSSGSSTVLHIEGLPEDGERGINKDIFTIEVI